MATKLTSRSWIVCGDVMQRRVAHVLCPQIDYGELCQQVCVIQGVTEAEELRSTDFAESTDNGAVAISGALSVIVAHGELDCNLETSKRRGPDTLSRIYRRV